MIEVEIIQDPSYEQLVYYWQQLSGGASGAIFINEPWIFPWFKQISQYHSPQLLLIKDQGLLAVAVLHQQLVWHQRVFRRKFIYLNEMPLSGNNMVVEYNGLLCRDGFEGVAWNALCKWLVHNPDWHEIRLSALDFLNLEAVKSATKNHSLIISDLEIQNAPLIQFDQHSDWIEVERFHFSANRLYQIRRCLRLYEKKSGRIKLSVANSPAGRANSWAELERLHNQYWHKKGKQGSFANSKWKAFHESIDASYVQLVTIMSGVELIGVLYNLQLNGRVYNIQSGFSLSQDNKYKPGYLSHYLCAKYNYEMGASSYEFLGGGEHYKTSLAKHTHKLAWIRIRNPAKSYKLEDLIARIYRACISRFIFLRS